MAAKPKTIDEYLAALSDDKRAALEKLRKVIRAAAPKAEECISYQLPAFRQNGMLVAFGATSNNSVLSDRHLFWRIAQPNRQQRAVRAGQWKLLVDGGQFLLFDLRADPGEKHDLTARRPELVVKLKTLLEAWEKDVDQKPQANQF